MALSKRLLLTNFSIIVGRFRNFCWLAAAVNKREPLEGINWNFGKIISLKCSHFLLHSFYHSCSFSYLFVNIYWKYHVCFKFITDQSQFFLYAEKLSLSRDLWHIFFSTQEILPSFLGCLCDNWKPSFLPLLIFNWRTFSGWVTARWWRQWAKNQVLTSQNSRNKWFQIGRRTICSM